MTVSIGINGFGRIGRLALRAINRYHGDELEVVAVNDLTDSATSAHLFKWDTTYGRYPGSVTAEEDGIVIDGKKVKVTAERDPAKINWTELGADIVIESTGFFTDGFKAAAHLDGGAKKVIISAPAKNEDITMVLGVNQDKYNPAEHRIISNASCTTNGIAPMVKVIHEAFGIEKGLMSTIHSYTNDQRIQDQAHKDLRRARAAAANIIPTTTGAAKAVTQVMPELKGKLHGMAYRVPVLTVSVIDLVIELSCGVTSEEINRVLKEASEKSMQGILSYTEEPLVSSDFIGNPSSCTVDGLSTMVIGSNMAKLLSWYDNEWGYCCRLADLAAFIASKGC
ncbi:MAG: type I glyceraldehyde-3-phosphate dehydrogenase [Dehalococcoidales bacterium]|nr:type I glyceraldehyde-3-phosphate dehydrogenase [Dehalococcoidales bacterium]MDX9986448.1 type I glyceraldehyde-3-phosphate dehydrogenase [Dehalococcoidales bacterium]NLE90538.1 type I glyceraldehyde-3-phosphate dehydrogenase [Dehalococcoidales bacterium]